MSDNLSKKHIKLNQLLANHLVLYFKLHNYHWNIKGTQFFSLHEVSEKYYEHVAEVFDSIAERILQLEGTPLVTLKKALELAIIEEEEKTDFDTHYVVNQILKDFKTLRDEWKGVVSLFEDDPTTSNLIDSELTFLEKSMWMLRSFLKI